MHEQDRRGLGRSFVHMVDPYLLAIAGRDHGVVRFERIAVEVGESVVRRSKNPHQPRLPTQRNLGR